MADFSLANRFVLVFSLLSWSQKIMLLRLFRLFCNSPWKTLCVWINVFFLFWQPRVSRRVCLNPFHKFVKFGPFCFRSSNTAILIILQTWFTYSIGWYLVNFTAYNITYYRLKLTRMDRISIPCSLLIRNKPMAAIAILDWKPLLPFVLKTRDNTGYASTRFTQKIKIFGLVGLSP